MKMSVKLLCIVWLAMTILLPVIGKTALQADIEKLEYGDIDLLSVTSRGQEGSSFDSNDPSEYVGNDDGTYAFEVFNEWLDSFRATVMDSSLSTDVIPEAMRLTTTEENLSGPLWDDLLAEGINFANVRRTTMTSLIRKNPWRALDLSIKWEEWAILPQRIKTLVEEPFSEMGDLEVMPDGRPLSQQQVPWQTYRVTIRGRTFDAFVYGRRKAMTSKYGVPLQGIILDSHVVIWESPVVLLAPETVTVVQELFPDGNARDRSSWSGEPLGPNARVALCGGKLYYFASEEEVHMLAQTIAEAEKLLGPNTVNYAFAAAAGPDVFDKVVFERDAMTIASAWTETQKTVLAMRLDYTPAQGTPFTQSELRTLLLSCSSVLAEMSYGKTMLIPTVTPMVLTLPGSKEDYEEGKREISDDAQTAATIRGYRLGNYDIYLYSFPQGSGVPGAANGAHTWINGKQGISVFVHEFGHNYGLLHANAWLNETGNGLLGHLNPDGSLVEHEEYGDIFDLMGSGDINGHFSMPMKAYLNWIEPADVISVANSGVYRIYGFDHIYARFPPGSPLALKMDLREHGELWIGFRRNFTSNNSLSEGAYIVWAPRPRSNCHYLLDTTPLSQPNQTLDTNKEDAALALGESYTDPSGTVRITNLGLGGTAPFEYLDLDVTLLDKTPAIELFTDLSCTTRGLQGSYINRSMRDSTLIDWRRIFGSIGRRVDTSLYFPTNGWGERAPLGLTHGTDADWEDFSVQWDGVVVVNRPVQIATCSDDSSRMWIDLSGDGLFTTIYPEFVNNHWGFGQEYTQGDISITIAPGVYHIRIQYEEGFGANTFALVAAEPQFEVFTSAELANPGIVASFVNSDLRSYSTQDDWQTSQTISGGRSDPFPGFTKDSWGTRAAVGLTGGTDEDWENFSVQWDGYLCVYQPMRFATISDDSSRMWIDINNDNVFRTTSPEFINNNWGWGQNRTLGLVSTMVDPGAYQLRIQYEEGLGANYFILCGAP